MLDIILIQKSIQVSPTLAEEPRKQGRLRRNLTRPSHPLLSPENERMGDLRSQQCAEILKHRVSGEEMLELPVIHIQQVILGDDDAVKFAP